MEWEKEKRRPCIIITYNRNQIYEQDIKKKNFNERKMPPHQTKYSENTYMKGKLKPAKV